MSKRTVVHVDEERKLNDCKEHFFIPSTMLIGY